MYFRKIELLFVIVLYFVSVTCVTTTVNPTKNATTTSFAHLTTTSTHVCEDKLPDCQVYGQISCTGVYENWAHLNCEVTCGFCIPPTTVPPPCVDVLADCEGYGNYTCHATEYLVWAATNCRAFCRLCTAQQLAELDARTTVSTTIAPELCIDLVQCRLYGDFICNDPSYAGWSQYNCPLYCGYCQGVPTPPKPCVDYQPDCPSYGSDVCFDPNYSIWVEDHCPKFCGLCGNNTIPTTPPTATDVAHTTAPTTIGIRTPPPFATPLLH